MNPFFYSWTKQNAAVRFPVQTAENDEFILDDGRRIYDFISTSFQSNFGHSHSMIVDRIAEQLRIMPIASPKSSFELKSTVSNRLVNFVDRGNGKIFYTVSGSEAVENALKIARQITGRKIVLARHKSYHGASLGALSVTGDWRNQPHLTFDEGTIRIPEHDEDPELSATTNIIEQAGAKNIAAIILETISGTNGMSVPHQSWFDGVQALCRANGIMLIIDEVLVGFRRCHENFAFHGFQLQPDLICMSKAISGGYIPFGAVWASPSIAQYYDDEILCCGLTNYGHPLGLAALEGVLDCLDDRIFQNRMSELENAFEHELSRFEKRTDVKEVRFRGLMAAIYFDHDAPTWQQGFDHGLHFFSKDNFTIFAPPYVSEPANLKLAFDKYEQLLG